MWDEFSKSAFPVSKPSSHFLFILLCWFAHSSSHCWLCSWLLSPGNTQLPISPPEPPQVWMDHRCHLWLWGAGSGAPGTSSPVVLPSVSRTGTPIYELPTGILCIFRNLWKSGSVNVNSFDCLQECFNSLKISLIPLFFSCWVFGWWSTSGSLEPTAQLQEHLMTS